MDRDLTEMLADWQYDADDQYRVIKARDGRRVLQVRQPLGIEQYELDGRPDGLRPFGKESVLTEMLDRLHSWDDAGTGSFLIDHDDFLRLQNEGILYYYRYLILFQMGDFERTISDTSHNLQICDLVERFVEEADEKKEILQYRPYMIRMNAVAGAMLQLGAENPGAARDMLQRAIDEIGALDEVDTPTYHYERLRSLQYLRTALKQIKAPAQTVLEQLNTALDEAVEQEAYERAAELRDRIHALQQRRT
jgi:ElaB/YqjD/DUF883 family membrane-anchored ribosome-binding protein